jgi:hypothetical protein
VWVLRYTECPFRSHTVEPKDVFNWIATHHRDSDISVPHGRWVYYDERVKQKARLDHNYAAKKTKKASFSIAVLLLIFRHRNILHNPVVMPKHFFSV